MSPSLRLSPLAASAYISLFRSKLPITKALLEEALALSNAQVNDLDMIIVAIASGETWLVLEDYQRVVNDTDQFLLWFEKRGMQADAPPPPLAPVVTTIIFCLGRMKMFCPPKPDAQ
jgi:hypothetical protein